VVALRLTLIIVRE